MTDTPDDDKKKAKRFLMVDNSVLYNQIRAVVVTSAGWESVGPGRAIDIGTASQSLRGSARLGPEPGSESTMSDDALDEWKLKAADYVLTKMDDLNADLLDYIFSWWVQNSSSPEQSVIIRADDFFRCRGLRPRGHSYWTAQKKELSARLNMMTQIWINLFQSESFATDKNGNRLKLQKLRSRLIVVSSVAEEESESGDSEYAWRLRPGDLFLPMLTSKSGKQFAMLAKKVLEYDYYRFSWEKRCARYFTWLHRIRQGRGDYLKAIRVGSILTAIRKDVNANDPAKTKVRFERALDRLVDDEIIRGWQYKEAFEDSIGRKGWINEWKKWCVLVEPIQEVQDQYDKIKLMAPPQKLDFKARPATNELTENMRSTRIKRGLTQLQASEQMGISGNYVAMLERGVKVPSGRLITIITRWIAG